jgi:hypothetical protein
VLFGRGGHKRARRDETQKLATASHGRPGNGIDGMFMVVYRIASFD